MKLKRNNAWRTRFLFDQFMEDYPETRYKVLIDGLLDEFAANLRKMLSKQPQSVKIILLIVLTDIYDDDLSERVSRLRNHSITKFLKSIVMNQPEGWLYLTREHIGQHGQKFGGCADLSEDEKKACSCFFRDTLWEVIDYNKECLDSVYQDSESHNFRRNP